MPMTLFLVQSISVVELHQVADVEEGKEEAETFPHPGVEPVDGDVHLLPLAQGPQSVEAPLLVHVLQVLQERHVHIEHHVLVPGGILVLAKNILTITAIIFAPEVPVGGSVWPDE